MKSSLHHCLYRNRLYKRFWWSHQWWDKIWWWFCKVWSCTHQYAFSLLVQVNTTIIVKCSAFKEQLIFLSKYISLWSSCDQTNIGSSCSVMLYVRMHACIKMLWTFLVLVELWTETHILRLYLSMLNEIVYGLLSADIKASTEDQLVVHFVFWIACLLVQKVLPLATVALEHDVIS